MPIKVFTHDIDARSIDQLINVASLPCVHGHVAAMPDVHAGIGATVGSVIPTKDAIIPAAVGVDIGCGMHAVKLSLTAGDLPDNLKAVRSGLEAAVPVGFSQHDKPTVSAANLQQRRHTLAPILAKHPGLAKMTKDLQRTWTRQLGSLGGGNHFIELCLDEAEDVWLMLHSGSRGIGNAIGRYFIARAKKDMQRHFLKLPDKDLAYFSEGRLRPSGVVGTGLRESQPRGDAALEPVRIEPPSASAHRG